MKYSFHLVLLLLVSPITSFTQTFEWVDGFSGTNAKEAYSIATDSVGNVYTAGYFNGTVDFNPGAGVFNLTSAGQGDAFIQKTSNTGTFLWAKSIGGAGNDVAAGIAVDSSGNALITGDFYLTVDFDPGAGLQNLTSNGTMDAFVLKLDPAGNFVWVVQIGSTNNDEGYGIAVDDTGNVYTVGYTNATADFDPGAGVTNLPAGQTFYLLKLTPLGNFSFVKGWSNLAVETDVFIETNHNILITGFYSGTVDFNPGAGVNNLTAVGSANCFIMKLNAAGNFTWAKGLGSTIETDGSGITADAAGNIYVTGDFQGTADFDPSPGGTFNITSNGTLDFFILKLNSSGNFVWAKGIGGTAIDYGSGIDLDAHGHVFITGDFGATTDFDPGVGTFNVNPGGSTKSYIECLDSLGNFLWVYPTSGSGQVKGYAIAVDDSENVYATGIYSDVTDFDPSAAAFNLTPALVGNPDIYVLKVGQCFASFTGLAATYCSADAAVTLTGIPSGGTFSGAGISGNTFTPATAGAGPHTITYTVTVNGCTSSFPRNVVVSATPNANFTGLGGPYCANAAAVTLTPTTGGGTFSGTGVVGNTFDPTVAGAGGPYTITYTITVGGCTNSSSQNVTVNAAPNANWTPVLPPTFLVTDPAITLVPVTNGGVFSGCGVFGNTFSPCMCGPGTITITYTITIAGCMNQYSQATSILPSNAANFTGLPASCCESDPPFVLTPQTGGGTFTGNGIIGNTFYPNLAGPGMWWVNYSVTVNGCTVGNSQAVTVTATPNANFSGLAGPYCANAAAVTLTPTTTGGTFSGTGVVGNTFDPSVAGAGGPYTITYTITVAGCTNSSSQNVTVNAAPNATFTGLNAAYCSNAAAVTLTPTTGGGTFSGIGVFGNTFDPAGAGAGGPYTVTYTITAGVCTSTSSQNVTVNAVPSANFSGLAGPYCHTAGPVTLTPFTGGGTFSGPGVVGNTFNPSIAGAGGPYTITYTITAGGCTNTTSQTVSVTAPDAAFSGLATDYCLDASLALLTPNTVGGTFTGSGMNGYTFDPAAAGAGGPYTITYTITVAGCTNTSSQSVTVTPSPTVSFSGLNAMYCTDDAASTLTGNPAGGTFSGTGITGNSFDPSTAGAGTHQVMYNYTDGNGCVGADTISTTVNALPSVSLSLNIDTLCTNSAPVTISGESPTGGTFTGPGVFGTTFDPSISGGGTHTITYTYTDANGCSNSATDIITVAVCSAIDNLFSSGNWSLYPNPTSDIITLHWNGSETKEVKMIVMDVSGRVALPAMNRAFYPGGSFEIDLGRLSAGVYFVEVGCGDEVGRLRVVRE